jgi:hypothetical protein
MCLVLNHNAGAAFEFQSIFSVRKEQKSLQKLYFSISRPVLHIAFSKSKSQTPSIKMS